MLIIFDLDDTLIDTTRDITPVKLQNALDRMIDEGLEISDFEKSLNILLNIDQKSPSAKHTLKEFLQENTQFLEIGIQEVYYTKLPETPINPVDRAIETLEKLFQNHLLALVSVGIEQQQFEKLEKAGIDRALFSKITFTQQIDKKPLYKEIIYDLHFKPCDVIVCGDKVHIDLTPAKELGLTTVNFKHGRGLHSIGNRDDVDHEIDSLDQICTIIKDVNENNNKFSRRPRDDNLPKQ